MENNSTQASLKVSSSTGNDEKLHDTEQRDDEKVYPPKKIVLPAMAAIYLAVFLVALVCFHAKSSFTIGIISIAVP